MTKRYWTDPHAARPATEGGDEFTSEVRAAIDDLRTTYDLDNGDAAIDVDSAAADAESFASVLPSIERRGFLKLSGAAAVFGLTGCYHQQPQTLIGHRQQAEGTTIGNGTWFSSFVRVDGEAVGVLAKSYDGRPIKLDGNPSDPGSAGRLSVRGQAALLDLYDADRGSQPSIAGADTDWSTFDAQAGALLAGAGKIALLTGPVDGPANAALLASMNEAFGGQVTHVAYQPFAPDQVRAVREDCFGVASTPVYHFDQAHVLVTFGSDPLAGGQAGFAEARSFAKQRKLRFSNGPEMGQFFAFESTVSQAGAKADVRIRANLAEQVAAAWAVAEKVAVALGVQDTLPAGRPTVPVALKAAALADADPITVAADALVAAGKNGLVYVGGALSNDLKMRPLLEAAVFINSALGAEGTTVAAAAVAASAAQPSVAATKALLADLAAYDAVVVVGANPAYQLPHTATALQAVAEKLVVLADRRDETARLAKFYAPISHDLESWSDAEPEAGRYLLQQPLLRPLWNSRAWQQHLISLTVSALGDKAPAAFRVEVQADVQPELSSSLRKPLYAPAAAGVVSWSALLRGFWQSEQGQSLGLPAGDRAWSAALAAGAFGNAVAAPAALAYQLTKASAAITAQDSMHLVLTPSRAMGDGTQLNNAWLQESPDAITKVTWDNCLCIGLDTARTIGTGKRELRTNDVVEITAAGQKFLLPVVVVPGMAANVAEAFLGWGRADGAGAVAKDELGIDADTLPEKFNTFALTGSGDYVLSAQISAVGKQYKLAITQGHQYMDDRDIALGDVFELYKKDPGYDKRGSPHYLWDKDQGTGSINNSLVTGALAAETTGAPNAIAGQEDHNLSAWGSTHVYEGRRWGMVIDMNACNGCNACLLACNSENNVPVVGRDEVRLGREMHWIRIDRYYSTPADTDNDRSIKASETITDDELIEIFEQPIICQQCGHAPCEEVCPALAIIHDNEGVNVQVYNRCIGTRYCANNCPYKVRRFNFYEYSMYRFGPQGSRNPFARVFRNLLTDARTSGLGELNNLPLQMLLNPEVTQRSKGVMEKCNFCSARTKKIKEQEKRTGRKYDDRDIRNTVACAQTCPAEAITFGDLNDPFSEVNQVADQHQNGYKILDYMINTRPAVSYLRQVRNRPATEAEMKLKKKGHKKYDAKKGEHASADKHAGEGH
jgi:molybdopterin-containing oxidoreductase family iron-sulfur binding subunit